MYSGLVVLWSFSMSATQFRLAGIGLSELVFFLLIFMPIIYRANSLKLNESLLIFAIFFVLVLSAGWLTNAIFEKNFSGANRDAIALSYSILGSLILVSSNKFKINYVLLGSYLSIQFLFLAFCLSLLIPLIPIPIDFWYGGAEDLTSLADVGRFKGWSENPNQLGLFIISSFYYNFYILNVKFNSKIILSIPLIIIMVLVNSSATIMSVCILLVVPYVLDLNLRGRSSIFTWILKFCLYSISLFAFLIVSLLYFNKTGEFDGNGRLPLWENSLLALYESPFWGWGPGGHAGYAGPFEGWESHNIFIDILTQSGLLGLLAFLCLIGVLFNKLWHLEKHKQIGLVLSFLVYGFSHYMLRIPLLWIVFYAFFVSGISSENLRKSLLPQTKSDI